MSLMTRENRREAERLFDQGWTYQAIGEHFAPERSRGAQAAVGRRLVNYERSLEEAREWKLRNHARVLAAA